MISLMLLARILDASQLVLCSSIKAISLPIELITNIYGSPYEEGREAFI
jgi:hypothetical protein